jgi:hypothetical protein
LGNSHNPQMMIIELEPRASNRILQLREFGVTDDKKVFFRKNILDVALKQTRTAKQRAVIGPMTLTDW